MSVEYPDASVAQFLLVFVTVWHAIAVTMTCLRLWVRLRLRRLWWEDAWAFLALCLDVICAVATWMAALPQRDHPWYLSPKSHIVSVWLAVLSYVCLIWAARMSIMFSLIRMVPNSDRMRRITNSFAILFFFLWALSAASKAYTCGWNRSWYNLSSVQCPLGLPNAVIDITTDVISDVILISLPTRIMYRMKLPRNARILILSIFSMSLLNVIVSTVHVAFLIPDPGYMAGITADIEGIVDLMNCNLLVLVTTFYRILRHGEDLESTPWQTGVTPKPFESSSMRMTTNALTTVDLEGVETTSVHGTRLTAIPEGMPTVCDASPRRSCVDVLVERP